MLFKNIIAATALLFAGTAMGAADIATDAVSACNCPNNCDHTAGSSCKYYSGPSDTSPILSGTCADSNGQLICIAQ